MPNVYYTGAGNETDFEPRLSRSETEIHFLVHEKERLVESPYLSYKPGTYHQCGAQQKVDLDCCRDPIRCFISRSRSIEIYVMPASRKCLTDRRQNRPSTY